MSQPDDSVEKFLQRWSRRKAETRARDNGELSGSADAEASAPLGASSPSEPELPTFDPATLPPLESIAAASDVRAFLAPGVPEELTRAALRRAWVTDPTIRDFIGLAENQWDFTRPDGVAGFGSLEVTPGLLRMVAQLIGDAPAKAPSRSDPASERANQAADKPRELTPAATGRASDAGAAWLERAPAQGQQRTFKNATPDTLPIPSQADTNNAATQQSPREEVEISGSAHRRHGSAVPK